MGTHALQELQVVESAVSRLESAKGWVMIEFLRKYTRQERILINSASLFFYLGIFIKIAGSNIILLQMKNFWNERFGQPQYIYGKAPNVFFAEQLNKLPKGNLLLPAEGEGRNAVYAAIKGWKVTAFDYSEEAKRKALDLAREYEVEIDYQIKNADDFIGEEKYDVIALIYAHFGGNERSTLFKKLEDSIVPGGHLLAEVFSKNQMGRASGGPKDLDLLYSKDEINSSFPKLDFIILEETKVMLNEGSYHQGEAAVIRALGVRK